MCNGHSPRSYLGASSKSLGPPVVERVDLADSTDSLHADAKRDLVWQLELERLRNATLKLEVQREICEGSDLRKRLWETEAHKKHTTSTTLLLPVPPVPTTVTTMTSVPSVSRLPIAGFSQVTTSVSAPAVSSADMEVASTTPARILVQPTTVQQTTVPPTVQQTTVPLNQRHSHFSPRHRMGSLCSPVSPRRARIIVGESL